MVKYKKFSPVVLAVLIGITLFCVWHLFSSAVADTATTSTGTTSREGAVKLDLLWLAPIGSSLALLFTVYLWFIVIRKKSEGTDEMKKLSSYVREGAYAYLKRQYTGVGIFFVVVFTILCLLAFVFPTNQPIGKKYLTPFVPFAFLTGGFFSGLSGFIGMSVATRSNSRTTWAAKQSLNSGLRVAFSGGAVMGLVVVGLGLLDLSIWYYLLRWYYSNHLKLPTTDPEVIRAITDAMITFGMGASSMALFARVGGGIFTKAADVGADLVGKVEAGIPEDDPRNPAVIADNVGDNVGDVAGMGADLYESYVGSIVATMALGAAAFGKMNMSLEAITIPMVMASIGVLSSIIGTFLVRSGEKAEMGVLLWALRRGIFSSAILIAIFSFLITWATLGLQFIGVYLAVISGLLSGIIIGLATEYYTADKYKPTRWVAEQAQTGPATVIIGGMAVAMGSTVVPVVSVAVAILASFFLSKMGASPEFLAQFGITDPKIMKEIGNNIGLYGVGISAVGMLSTLGITLATDAYGPIADNAGGIAVMSHQEPHVRERTDALDSLGNTTAATGKGFAIGSAALTALALIAAYHESVANIYHKLGWEMNIDWTLMNPNVVVGLFIGGMMPFVFCSMTMKAVGRAAYKIVFEVRRQFKELKLLSDPNAKADYAQAVKISTAAAQAEMVVPSLMAIIVPIIVGFVAGVAAEAALLAGALVTGFVLAVMMANAGGSWDNAKKYIEGGRFGGKGSDAHKAGVVGDTVGDPFKDTSGPSLNILIKLMSMVSLVFASFIIQNTLVK